MIHILFAIAICFFVYPGGALAQVVTKIVPSGIGSSDIFGVSVSISGDYAIAGTASQGVPGVVTQSAYVFQRMGTSWPEVGNLTSSDHTFNGFGSPVSIDHDYVIIGAPYDDDNGAWSGSVYVFQRQGSTWVEMSKLTPSDGAEEDRFGEFLSLSGEYAIVGSFLDDDNGDRSGAAYIFHRQGALWSQASKLLPDDGDIYDLFGSAVSISGDYSIVGALFDGDYGSYSGSAYIFYREGTEWIQLAKLHASDASSPDRFGEAVSIEGDFAIIGAPHKKDRSGAAYIFRREGTNWVQISKLMPDQGICQEYFGSSVDISDDYAIVGAPTACGENIETGAAYVYKRKESGWIRIARLTASDGEYRDRFGGSVAVDGDVAIVGAPWDDNEGGLGSVYLYDLTAIGTGTSTRDQVPYIASTNGVSAQNYPNPFARSTTIKYLLQESTPVNIVVYDVLGRIVQVLADGVQPAGEHEIFWVADPLLPDGLYILRIMANREEVIVLPMSKTGFRRSTE